MAMSDINKKLIMHALKYGLIMAGVQIGFQLLVYILNFETCNLVLGIISMIIALAVNIFFMVYASVQFRNKYLDKKISFIRCWMIGLIIGLSATILAALYTYIFYSDAEQLRLVNECKINMISENSYVPDSQKEEIIRKMIAHPDTAVSMMLSTLSSQSIFTVVISLLSTLFVRKKEKVVDNVY
jgi:hypothetical protein